MSETSFCGIFENMQRISDFLDSLDFSLVTIMSTIGFLTILRLFLESFSSPEVTGLFAPLVGIISYATLYGMLITLLAGLLVITTKKSVMWSLRVITLVFPVILLTPIIDLIISGGSGFCIGYAQAESHTIGYLFTHFLAPHASACGITPGLRFQILAVVLGLGAIAFVVTKNWWKSIVASVGAYIVAFIGGSFPIIISRTFLSDATNSLIATIHYPTDQIAFTTFSSTMTTLLLARVQMIGLIIGGGILWYIGSRKVWRAWWRGFAAKLPIAGIHAMLAVFGLMVGWNIAMPQLVWADWVGIVMLISALLFACSSLGAQNDLRDVAIDMISNRKWWLIDQQMSVADLKMIRVVSGIFAIACAMIVNYNALFCILVFMGAYTIYSDGLRLKQFWFASSFLIATAGCAAFLSGFFTLSADQVVGHVPVAILAMIATLLIPYSIIKDIPDVAGDKQDNIKTFSVLFNQNKATVFAAIILIAWFVIFKNIIPWFLAIGVIIPVIILVFKKSLIHSKIWLLGLPVGIWSAALLVHILFLN